MKIFVFTALILAAGISNASTVYYCSDTTVAGFDPSANGQEIRSYKPGRFKLKVDWRESKMTSPDIYLREDSDCYSSSVILTCVHTIFGVTLTLHGETLRYNRSNIFNMHHSLLETQDSMDDIYVATGSCEEF